MKKNKQYFEERMTSRYLRERGIIMANKVRYGLKNVHVASVTIAESQGQQTVTFGTPQAWVGAVNMSMEPTGDTSDFYADDSLYFTGRGTAGYDCSLETALVPDWFYTDYLGMHTDDANNIVETGSDEGKYFAFLFEFTGDVNAIRHCLYYCKASAPTEEGETKGESAEPATTTVEFKASPIPVPVQIDGEDKNVVKKRSTPSSTDYNTWYTTVALPTF